MSVRCPLVAALVDRGALRNQASRALDTNGEGNLPGDERPLLGRPAPDSASRFAGFEPGVRPISASIRRRAIAPTAPQSDSLARLLTPGARRLVELFSLRNGTLCATLRGAGYAARRVYITPDGRLAEDEEASEPDPFGEATQPFILARDPDRLHLGTLLPGSEDVRDQKLDTRVTESGAPGESGP